MKYDPLFKNIRSSERFQEILNTSKLNWQKEHEKVRIWLEENTSNNTFHKINEIVSAKDSILEFIKKDDRKFRNPDDLVKFLFSQPFSKVKHFVDAGIYAENTARDYLSRLCDMKVLEKKEIEGHHYYLNLELYRILSE